MAGAGIGLEYPILIVLADGTTIWEGCGFLDTVQRSLINTDTVAAAAGQIVAFDGPGSTVQPWDRASSSAPQKQVLAGKLAYSTGSLDTLAGVCVVPTPVGSPFLLAGNGSVVPVKVTAAGTIRYNVVATTTAGSGLPQSAVATAPATTLGKIIKIAGAVGGTTDSGSASYAIVAVNIF